MFDRFVPKRTSYQFLQNLHRGIDISVVLLTYSPGNNRGNLHFIWKLDGEPLETVFQKSLLVVESIKPLLPQYHTRAMRKSLLSKYRQPVSNLQCYGHSTKISLVIAVLFLT